MTNKKASAIIDIGATIKLIDKISFAGKRKHIFIGTKNIYTLIKNNNNSEKI
jgi:hypothetical protein